MVMADDIDDLLDEVEDKFVKGRRSDTKPNTVKPRTRGYVDEEVDKLMEDICVENDSLIHKKCNNAQSNPRKTSQTRSIVPKCFPLCIGGASTSHGHGNSVNKRSCDALRCTSCDFRVVSFDNFVWDRSTDYLFLRNHAPDFDRLKSKLAHKKGYRAYCCQCCHMAVNELTDVKDLPVKWVCGQH